MLRAAARLTWFAAGLGVLVQMRVAALEVWSVGSRPLEAFGWCFDVCLLQLIYAALTAEFGICSQLTRIEATRARAASRAQGKPEDRRQLAQEAEQHAANLLGQTARGGVQSGAAGLPLPDTSAPAGRMDPVALGRLLQKRARP